MGEGVILMFDLPENQREFYYQTYISSEEEYDEDGYLTGEDKSSYSNPILAKAMISENTSEAVDMPFGKDLVYDKMISTVQDLPIDEYSKLSDENKAIVDNGGYKATLDSAKATVDALKTLKKK